MAEVKKSDDYAFALEVCQKLRAGSRKAILAVHSRYHERFVPFVRQRLCRFPRAKTDKVLNSFWLELMDGETICAYHGQGPLSLYSFLTVKLKWRIKDEIRRIDQETKRRAGSAENDDSDFSEDERLTRAVLKNGEPHPDVEERLIREERRHIVRAVLLEMQEQWPDDAHLIRMRFLKDLTYKEIARLELVDDNPTPELIAKKEQAIKKQFTRKHTGSMDKFKRLLEGYAEKHGINIKDFLV